MKKQEKQQDNFRKKVCEFFKENGSAILAAGLGIAGIVVAVKASYEVGKNDGEHDMADKVAAVMPHIVDKLGVAGSLAALDALDDQLGEDFSSSIDHDAFGRRACRHYYEDYDAVKSCMSMVKK